MGITYPQALAGAVVSAPVPSIDVTVSSALRIRGNSLLRERQETKWQDQRKIFRTVLLVIALINQILTSTGHPVLPFDDQTVTEVITLAFTLATSIVAWWQNNSFTKEAIQADNYMNAMKARKKG